jgi:cell division protein FtsB
MASDEPRAVHLFQVATNSINAVLMLPASWWPAWSPANGCAQRSSHWCSIPSPGRVIAYFGLNAYSGNRGLRAKQDLEEQIAQLNNELAGLRAERATWERRVLLLRPGSIDPDMLDERARTLLNYADPRELTLRLKPTLARP